MAYKYRIIAEEVTGSPAIKVKGAPDAARYLYANCFTGNYRESCWALLLDAQRNILGHYLVSEGACNSTIIDKKNIALVALNAFADSVILSHNHPSGNVTPSARDKEETFALKRALECVDLRLLDHVIVSEDKYYSFAEEHTYKRARRRSL